MKKTPKKEKMLFMALFLISVLFLQTTDLDAALHKSNWSSKDIEVNADPADWQGLPLVEDSKSKTAFSFQNDAENLFILFVFRDMKTLSSMQETGITLWIGPEKEKKRRFGILYKRISLPPENLIALLEKDGRILAEEQKTAIRSKPVHHINQNRIIIKGKDTEIPIRMNDQAAPQFSQKMANRELYFEFRIPLSLIAEHVEGYKAGGRLNLGFEWGGATPEMRKRVMSDPGQNVGYASDEGLNLDTQGRTLASDRIDRQREFKTPKKWVLWCDLQLASQAEL